MASPALEAAAGLALLLSTASCAVSLSSGATRPHHEVAAAHTHHPDVLGIPPGHLPPPGECRVWYPGRPPGQQPPPRRCSAVGAEAPPGTWLLFRPHDDPEVVHVRVIDSRRAGVVVLVHVYDAERGRHLRDE